MAGNDVYVSGNVDIPGGDDQHLAYYWKNGLRKALLDPAFSDYYIDLYAESIAVAGNDVYIGGTVVDRINNDQKSAIYWKNGEFAGLVDSGISVSSSCYLTSTGNYIYQTTMGRNAYDSSSFPLYGRLGTKPAQILGRLSELPQVFGIAVVQK